MYKWRGTTVYRYFTNYLNNSRKYIITHTTTLPALYFTAKSTDNFDNYFDLSFSQPIAVSL